MTADIPNAFIQAKLPNVKNSNNKKPDEKNGEDRVMMKITGVLVDMLVQLHPQLYGKFVVHNNGKKKLYVWALRALYGMLTTSLLWYKMFRKDLESIGFKFSPYDPCVTTRKVYNKQPTI